MRAQDGHARYFLFQRPGRRSNRMALTDQRIIDRLDALEERVAELEKKIESQKEKEDDNRD